MPVSPALLLTQRLSSYAADADGNLQPYAARWNRIVKRFKQLLVPVMHANAVCVC
jgi:hypothetical protein